MLPGSVITLPPHIALIFFLSTKIKIIFEYRIVYKTLSKIGPCMVKSNPHILGDGSRILSHCCFREVFK